MSLDRAEIESAYEQLQPFIRQTPIVRVAGADFGRPSCSLTFKLEQLQHAGSFKTRGAFANLLRREIPAAGVVAASGGNHGAAVAYAARQRGVAAKIFVPTVSSAAKVARIRDYGADLVVTGERYADALAASEQWASESGALPIHAYDQYETLLGQATLALELSRQAPDLDSVLVAVGGGGLIGGVASWFAAGSPARGGQPVRVVGVEPEGAPTLTAALQAGRPVDAPAGSVAADSLAPRQVGQLMFPIAVRSVASVALVDDAAIRQAQEQLWSVLRLVIEPGGAAATAAVLSGAYQSAPGERIGIVLSGANSTAVDFDRH